MIFDYFRGSFAASKVSNAVMASCSNIVNYLIFAGYEVQIKDTARVMSELYCLALFGHRMSHRNYSAIRIKAYSLLLKDNLAHLLEKVLSQGIPIEMLRTDGTVPFFIDQLDGFYQDWCNSLKASERDNLRKTSSEWVSCGLALTWDNIDYYFHTESEVGPQLKGEHRKDFRNDFLFFVHKNILELAKIL